MAWKVPERPTQGHLRPAIGDGWLALELQRHTLLCGLASRTVAQLPVELPVELERVLRQAAGFADELLSDLAGRPGMTGLDVWVGWPDRRGRRRSEAVFMSAFLARWPEPNQQPVLLEHVEPEHEKRSPATVGACADGGGRQRRDGTCPARVGGRPTCPIAAHSGTRAVAI
jgi:hypothetical protein